MVKVFTSFGSSGSFLNRKDGYLSGNYCGKLLMAALRALVLLLDLKTPKRWAIKFSVADATESHLKNLQKRYQGVGKRERSLSREKKESNVLTPHEINQVLEAPHVKGVLEKAANSLQDETLKTSCSREFSSLQCGVEKHGAMQ